MSTLVVRRQARERCRVCSGSFGRSRGPWSAICGTRRLYSSSNVLRRDPALVARGRASQSAQCPRARRVRRRSAGQ